MADESILRAVKAGRSYGDLPQRARDLISKSAWNKKVSETCARKRLRWDSIDSLQEACKEGDYYAQVVKLSTAAQQLFPYHLFPEVGITPFKYYIGILHQVLKKDQAFAQIPNFTAADMVRVTGIGRDEYVPLMQACKAKRILWKVNRDSAIRDQLPVEPLDLLVEPWWQLRALPSALDNFTSTSATTSATSSWSSPTLAAATNKLVGKNFQAGDQHQQQQQQDTTQEDQVGCEEREERAFLSDLLRQPMVVDHIQDGKLWKRLYRRGLIHIEVPMDADDCIAVPPLEGFVSNKDGDEDSDPVEKLLYGMFFAASARTTIRELAHVLDAPLSEVREAASVACRLGFARRTTQERRVSISHMIQSPDGLNSATSELNSSREMAAAAEGQSPSNLQPGLADAAAAAGGDLNERKGIAFVVDTQVTATLMMGSLLKDQRHAVTLFEAGKLSGRLAVRELLDELSRVPPTGEGEIQFLVNQIHSLQSVLNIVCTIKGKEEEIDQQELPPEIDILRYEVLAELPNSTLSRMLSQHYFLVVFMAKLPLPLLQVPILREGPIVHGLPSEMAAMPWMQLLIFQQLGSGITSVALPKGMQLRCLPESISRLDNLLLEVWPEEGNTEKGGAHQRSVVLQGSSALGVINETLLTSAVLVQEITVDSLDGNGELVTFDVVLPLVKDSQKSAEDFMTDSSSGQSRIDLGKHKDVLALSKQLGLENSIGYLTLLRVSTSAEAPLESRWKVKGIHFGIPLHSVELCKRVCSHVQSRDVFSAGNLDKFHTAMLGMNRKLEIMAEKYCRNKYMQVYLPNQPLVFNGTKLSILGQEKEEKEEPPPATSMQPPPTTTLTPTPHVPNTLEKAEPAAAASPVVDLIQL
jgi:hypothetical protein